jgi:hypothetical protein
MSIGRTGHAEIARRIGARGLAVPASIRISICERNRRSAMRSLLAATIIVMATPALAQISPNLMGDGIKLKTDVEVKQEQERENGYKAGLSKIPDQKAKADPWGNVRASTPQANPTQRAGSK